MIRYMVTALQAQDSPAGPVLDRIRGPGWTATPEKMLEMLRSGVHQFFLAETDPALQLIARRDGNSWTLAVIDPAGNMVEATSLPHWQVDTPVNYTRPKRRWWERIMDPDAS